MANHKQAVKRNRQNLKRKEHNKHFRSVLKNAVKSLRNALETEAGEKTDTLLKSVVSIIHKSETKGIIKQNKASRLVSRLSKFAHLKSQKSAA